ncbi:hypothetical protein BS50DRAFT_595926 [Corynespora cassiicola Philippines]|uniref:Uncharacterized protein n=1 Tax=Corynespora cassiicola Philippines TaxID=1448308 RepID=A0A2T2PBD4_CORCC|nr:hypothetical protein BS50DRAFT_595926 [Corynespora cassiicola Philippines]
MADTTPSPGALLESRILKPELSLATIFGQDGECEFVDETTIEKFLEKDLNLDRLNRIHRRLWAAGRPMRARPLHRYKMMGMEVMPSQQMDLHLLKFSNRLILKPLPEWILDYGFWTRHLCGDDDRHHKSACGFLLSYVWLINTPLDLKLAHDANLLPSCIVWSYWRELVASFVKHININTLHQVNKRYHFGELRLGRINTIYRLFFPHTHFVRGYLYGYNRYGVFFERNFGGVLVCFVLFSMALSAMQVGTGVPELSENHAFMSACYGFVIVCIICVAIILAIVSALFTFIYFFNMGAAIYSDKDKRRTRERATKRLKEGKEV